MTLTEEQQEAIKYAISSLEQCGSEPEDPVVAKILRAMIDSSGTVEPTGGFDLEKARDAAKFDDAEALRMFPDSLAEIERMRAENADLSKAVIDISQERDLAQAEFRAYHKAWEQQTDRIKELEADLEQSERVIEARLDVIDQQAARIQELGGMLSIRTEELEIAHSCARSEREMHEKELVVFARKIAELEDALVEGLTNFLHRVTIQHAAALMRKNAMIVALGMLVGMLRSSDRKPASSSGQRARSATVNILLTPVK